MRPPGVQYDQLLVSGNLTLEGTVQLAFINGFIPNLGDRFDLLADQHFDFSPSAKSSQTPRRTFNILLLSDSIFTVQVGTRAMRTLLLLLGGVGWLLFVAESGRRRHLDACSNEEREHKLPSATMSQTHA